MNELAPLSATAAGTPVRKVDPKNAQTAKDFEAMFLGQMTKMMLESVEKGEVNGGAGEEMFKGVLAEKLGTEMANRGGVGLADFGDRYPHQLSGGMRKRTALAQVLALDPDIILMDEPFSALDIQTRQLMENELLELWSADRKSVVFITHDLDEALFLADRLLVMSPRPGRIIEDLRLDFPRPRTTELVTRPEFSRLKRHCLELLRHADGRQLPRLNPLGLPPETSLPRFAL